MFICLLDLEVFSLYSEDIASAMLAAIKDDEFIHCNNIVKQLDQWPAKTAFSHANDPLNNGNYIALQLYNLSKYSQLINGHYQHSNQAFMVSNT